ncbi:MAG TPA: MarR family EPS-associated transcriptional regulator [Gammaproteobacteria bacterium]|nr:MarR family EPS-associated transcriptional regulator [Gammaproteobacteria bacterium]
MLDDETRYRLLKKLQADPAISQRDLARDLGVSLGKANYCLRALVAKGWIKAGNFRNSRNKSGYLYQLTPSGLEAKARLTVQFLKIKQAEYEEIRRDLEALQREAEAR